VIIYATLYDRIAGRIIGESVDSGFESIDQVIKEIYARFHCAENKRYVCYNMDTIDIYFSDFPFYFEHPNYEKC